jgi:dolichol-phosphate mannosyltransferase
LKILIIIPTLNESRNIYSLIHKIFYLFNHHVLVVDDNSSDGTYEKLKILNKKFKKFKYLVRKKEKGIGSAHLKGIYYAYKHKFDFCISMDADGTHNPLEIKKMIKLALTKKYDVINTSRFLDKKSLSDWPYIRRIITRLRFILVKFFLNTKIDSSSGFRCYNLKNIKSLCFKKVNNKEYFFLIEILYILEKKGYKIFDIPINLKYRVKGVSKMRLSHIFNSLIYLILLSFKKKF